MDAHLVAPSWDPEEEYERAQAMLADMRADATSPGVSMLMPTVRDFVQVHGRAGRTCIRGGLQHRSNIRKGTVSTQFATCKQANCENCAPWWVLHNVVGHALRAFGGAPVYRRVYLTYDAYRADQALRKRYAGKHLRIAVGYRGEQWVFFPGQPGEGDPVDDVALWLVEAALQAPADTSTLKEFTGQKHRYQRPKLPPRDEGDRDEAETTEPDERDFYGRLPRHVPRVLADEVLPAHGLHVYDDEKVNGYELARAIKTRVTGRQPETTAPTDVTRSSYSIKMLLQNCTEVEIVAIRDAVVPLISYEKADRMERLAAFRERERILREHDAHPPRY